MNEVIPAILFLFLCTATFIFSRYWLRKHDSKRKIHSVNSNNISYEKLINTHIRNIKIGSIILIIVTILKIIYILLKML